MYQKFFHLEQTDTRPAEPRPVFKTSSLFPSSTTHVRTYRVVTICPFTKNTRNMTNRALKIKKRPKKRSASRASALSHTRH